MKRGDLGQPRSGAPGYPDEPGNGASEPAIVTDNTLRDQSAADSSRARDLADEDSAGGGGAGRPQDSGTSAGHGPR